MKLYITDIEYAKQNEQKLRKLRLTGNMILLYGDNNRLGFRRRYNTLANYFISDNGEFAFSGCFTLFNRTSAYLDQVSELLKQNNVRFSFARPYANACGGLDLIARTDENLKNENHTYSLSFDSEKQMEEVTEMLKPYCSVKEEEGEFYLIFHDSNVMHAIKGVLEHEKIAAEDAVFLSEPE